MTASNTGARHDPGAVLGTAPQWPVQEDMHLHTNASDGTVSPAEIVEIVSRSSLRLFAVTDHDTTSGLDEAEAASAVHPDITFIPGIELSAEVNGNEIHLTCHFIDRHNEMLQAELSALLQDREEKAEQIVQRLIHIGLPVSWDEVVANADGAIGRPHIARAMIARGYVETVSDAFSHYCRPANPHSFPDVNSMASTRSSWSATPGGVATVAHPRTVANIGETLATLAPHGLAGIEVYAEKYGGDRIGRYSTLADRYGLVKSGGSDYHANDTVNEIRPGMNGPPPGTARALYERAVATHGIDGVGYQFDPSKL